MVFRFCEQSTSKFWGDSKPGQKDHTLHETGKQTNDELVRSADKTATFRQPEPFRLRTTFAKDRRSMRQGVQEMERRESPAPTSQETRTGIWRPRVWLLFPGTERSVGCGERAERGSPPREAVTRTRTEKRRTRQEDGGRERTQDTRLRYLG